MNGQQQDGRVLATVTVLEVFVDGTPSVAADITALDIKRPQLLACLQLLVSEMEAGQ